MAHSVPMWPWLFCGFVSGCSVAPFVKRVSFCLGGHFPAINHRHLEGVSVHRNSSSPVFRGSGLGVAAVLCVPGVGGLQCCVSLGRGDCSAVCLWVEG